MHNKAKPYKEMKRSPLHPLAGCPQALGTGLARASRPGVLGSLVRASRHVGGRPAVGR